MGSCFKIHLRLCNAFHFVIMRKIKQSPLISIRSFYKKYRKIISIIIASVVFFSILKRRPMGTATATGNETFALLIFSILLWISNPVPIYVTALAGPVIAVWLQVLVNEGTSERLERKEAGELVLKFMINQIVTVALGGFVLAKALNKALSGTTHFAKLFAKHASRGKSFCFLLLGMILTPMYLSAVIPHEAAVLVTFNLIAPVIYALPADSSVAKVSLLAIMLGGNLGGMLSSISTPQNILLFSSDSETGALDGHFKLTFFVWAKVSVPVTLVSALGCWIGLMLIWRPWRLKLSPESTAEILPVLDEEQQTGIDSGTSIDDCVVTPLQKGCCDKKLPAKPLPVVLKYWTFLVAIITIFLWLSSRYLQNIFGGLGIVSFVPIVALFGAGVLDRNDLHELPWDVVLLAMGATTLSAICKNSGLFELLENDFEVILGPLNGWYRIAVLCLAMTISSAIKSRYIAALVYLPLAFRAIGSTSSAETAAFIVGQKILVAFACSAGMLLPISGLINAFIIQIGKDEKYISTTDLTIAGALGTIISLISIVSVGYFMIKFI